MKASADPPRHGASLAVFAILLVAYVLSQFYRAFLAVIAPEIARDLGLDPQALADMQAWWIAGFVAMQFPVGWALDAIGPRRVVAALMLLAVVGAGLFARARTAFDLDLAMALIGVGCSAIYMGALYLFGRAYRREQFALAASAMLGLGSAGNLAAASPMAWAATAYGWRASMAAIAVATAVSALSVALAVRDPPPAATHGRVGFFEGLAAILSKRALWPLIPLTAVSYAVILAERGLWAGPFFAGVYGLDPTARGRAILAMAAAMSVGALAYGAAERRLAVRKPLVAAGSLVVVAGFLGLGLFDLPLGAAVVAMAVIGFFGMSYGVLMAHGRMAFDDALLGRGITTLNLVFIGGAGVLQPISGRAMTAMQGLPPALAYQRLHLAFGLTLLAALAIYAFSREPRHAP